MVRQKGFTLIELMIVIAIIGILAVIAIPRFVDMVDKAREGATKGNIGAIRGALVVYYGDNEGRYPKTLGTDSDAWPDYTAKPFVSADYGYMDEMPQAQLRRKLADEDHDVRTNSWIASATPDNSGGKYGGWMYDSNTGKVRINSPSTDTKGKYYSDTNYY